MQNHASIEGAIVKVLGEIVPSALHQFPQGLGSEVNLVADLGLTSIDFVRLAVGIEDELGCKLGFHDLFMQGADYVGDLTIAELTQFIFRKTGDSAEDLASSPKLARPLPPPPTHQMPTAPVAANQTGIDANQVKVFQQAIAKRLADLVSPQAVATQRTAAMPDHPDPSRKGGKAIFILSPPRSGSTLLRVLLAGHPKLFAPPELHLLSYADLKLRKAALQEIEGDHLAQGVVRAVMQLKGCSSEEASQLVSDYEEQGLPTAEFYRLLQQWQGEKILVDKTPTYAAHTGILERAERYFEHPIYIHLVRHPYGMIYSYETAKLERIVPIMNSSSFERRELAEMTWLVSNTNIVNFLKTVPLKRQFRIRFEDLVQNPETVMMDLCAFLNIEFFSEMIDPYKERSQRMTDGVKGVSEMSGDLKFHLHQKIEADMAYRWQHQHGADFLSDISLAVAHHFGYSLAA